MTLRVGDPLPPKMQDDDPQHTLVTHADLVGQEKFMSEVQSFFESEYKDRGMKKWQGFFLSDHTAALKRQAFEDATDYPAESLQPGTQVRELLSTACANGNGVIVQLKPIDTDGHFNAPVYGKVYGYSDADEVRIGNADYLIDAIRNVQVMSFKVQ